MRMRERKEYYATNPCAFGAIIVTQLMIAFFHYFAIILLRHKNSPEVTIELDKATICSARGGRSDRRLLIAERNPHVGVGLRLAFHELIAGL